MNEVIEMHKTMDAQVWAKEFVNSIPLEGISRMPKDEYTHHCSAWFANAIECAKIVGSESSGELETLHADIARLRPEVRAFALKMETALSSKDIIHNGNSWQRNTVCEEILSHLMDRITSIAAAITYANHVERTSHCDMEINECWHQVMRKAVHVGNFAMMIADIAQPQEFRQALQTEGGA